MAQESIFDSARRLQQECQTEFDFIVGDDGPSIDEAIEYLLSNSDGEEIYKTKVVRNPGLVNGLGMIPTLGYIRYVPGIEIQFWTFPGEEKRDISLRELLDERVVKYKEGKLSKDQVWETICWNLDVDDSDEDPVKISISGMLIKIWYEDDPNKYLSLQILGLG